MKVRRNWTVPRIWEGEKVFIVAGGLSVENQDLSLIKGRRVIVINTSYEKVPDAQFLFSMDGRWLRHHKENLAVKFRGQVITNSATVEWPGLLILDRVPPPGLCLEPTALTGKRTSLHGAINLAILLGSKNIVLLGADGGGVQYNGRTHHHTAHPWHTKPSSWDEQYADLRTTIKPLKDLGVTITNCSPGTKWADLWTVVDRLEKCV